MIELKGTLRSVSALDSNVYVLITESGKHVGDLTLVDNTMIDKIDAAMAKRVKDTSEIKEGDPRRVPTNLPITLVIRVRQ